MSWTGEGTISEIYYYPGVWITIHGKKEVGQGDRVFKSQFERFKFSQRSLWSSKLFLVRLCQQERKQTELVLYQQDTAEIWEREISVDWTVPWEKQHQLRRNKVSKPKPGRTSSPKVTLQSKEPGILTQLQRVHSFQCDSNHKPLCAWTVDAKGVPKEGAANAISTLKVSKQKERTPLAQMDHYQGNRGTGDKGPHRLRPFISVWINPLRAGNSQ